MNQNQLPDAFVAAYVAACAADDAIVVDFVAFVASFAATCHKQNTQEKLQLTEIASQ